MKIFYWVLLMLMCVINTCATFEKLLNSWANIFIALGTFATAIIALIALLYTKREYHKQQERTKISVLGKFNERYCNSEPIQRVIAFLMAKEDFDIAKKNHKNINNNITKDILKKAREELDNTKRCCRPRDRELFMRFFAEIQISINSGLIDREYAKVMFGYYAVVATNMGKNFVNDYNEIYWSVFRVFAESMRQLDYAKCLDKINNHHKTIKL